MALPLVGMLVGPVASLLDTVLKRVLPGEKISEAERARLQQELELELQKMDWASIEGQLKINLEEAKNPRLFVSGWRPYIGWVCGSALAYAAMFQPLLVYSVSVVLWFHAPAGTPFPPPPALDTASLVTILLSLLGLGGMRTYEKKHGVESNR